MAEPHRCSIPLRWVDSDAQGHVNHAVVVDYLQEARVDYLLRGPNAHLLGNGVIVVGHQVEYVAPIDGASRPLDVALRVGDVGASRFTIAYELTRSGGDGVRTLVARARTQLCVFDFATQRPTRLQPAEREAFAADAADLDPLPSIGAWRVGERAHSHAVAVRWSDLDSYGHVNNTRFFTYLGEARIALLGGLLAPAADAASPAWVIARQDLAYVGQLAHRLEPYRVRTALAHRGRTSLTLAAEIDDPASGAVAARALTVVVFRGADGQSIPVPDAVAVGLARWPAEPSGRLGLA